MLYHVNFLKLMFLNLNKILDKISVFLILIIHIILEEKALSFRPYKPIPLKFLLGSQSLHISKAGYYSE